MQNSRYGLHLFILALIISSTLAVRGAHPTVVFADVASYRAGAPVTTTAALSPAPGPFAYGAAVAHRDGERVAGMGFNWMITYDPPHRREPVNVLYRVPVSHYSIDPDDYWSRWQFQDKLYQLAGEHGDWIDAYEIGNEVNLYVNGWDGPPNPHEYVELLCLAYETIKIMDPSALVISAGLAPVGRVQGNWNGFAGHNYLTQDEREFFRAFLEAGGDECADAFGYHPLGFRADFDAAPDVNGGTPETNCENGFCFRGIEKFHAVAEALGKGDTPIWATEVGWIVEPDDPACLNDYSWAGRQWQQVTRAKQTENLIGAFTYAREHWPWLGGIFIFNLNFHEAPYYHACEQMRYYSIQDSESEVALRGMIEELFSFVYLPLIAHESTVTPLVTDCAADGTIDARLTENGHFTILLKAFDRAGISTVLNDCGALTLFAPTDAAFQAVMDQFELTEEQLLGLPELADVLHYHIVDGALFSNALHDGMLLPTYQGDMLQVAIDGDTLLINEANLLATDIAESNGVIHVIDRVLVPVVRSQ